MNSAFDCELWKTRAGDYIYTYNKTCTIIKPERWHLPGRGGGEKTYEISVARNRLRQNNNATVILCI